MSLLVNNLYTILKVHLLLTRGPKTHQSAASVKPLSLWMSSVKGSIILPPFRLTADDAVILKATLTQSRFLLYMQNLFKSERLLICKTLVTGHSDQQEAVHFPPKGR